MSRRRARRRRRSVNLKPRGRKVIFAYGYPVLDAETGRVDWLTGACEVDAEDARAESIYGRAHALLPPRSTPFFDPAEYAAHAPDAAAVLRSADDTTPEDDVLRALAVLGHAPSEYAVDALFGFVARGPRPRLARVARLAIAECVALGGELGAFTAAS